MLPPRNKSLLVIEDDKQAHRLFQLWFSGKYDFHFAFTGEEALGLLEEREFPVATLDLSLPGKSGLEILPVLRKINPFQKIIILTANASQESAICAMNQGAFKYLEKPCGRVKIQEALEEGFERYSQERSTAVEETPFASDLVGLGLSRREAEIAGWVLHRETNSEIARRLFVSPRTVEKHLEAIFSKLKINSRVNLAPKVRQLRACIE
jgi:DNA-binding NarL/FixJ family response regulator